MITSSSIAYYEALYQVAPGNKGQKIHVIRCLRTGHTYHHHDKLLSAPQSSKHTLQIRQKPNSHLYKRYRTIQATEQATDSTQTVSGSKHVYSCENHKNDPDRVSLSSREGAVAWGQKTWRLGVQRHRVARMSAMVTTPK